MEKFRYYLDGPGETLITTTDFKDYQEKLADSVEGYTVEGLAKKIICVVTAKSASFTGGAEEEDITGGRSLAPRRKMLTGREQNFEITDCEMDFRYVSLSQGEAIEVGAVTSWAFGEDHWREIAETSITLEETPIADTLVLQDEDGTILEKVESTPTVGQYSISAKVVTFHADQTGIIKPMYQFTSPATTQQVSTLNTSVPKTVSIVHHQPQFDDNNKVIGTQEIEIYRASVSGEFEQAFEERSPYAPSLTFQIMDPKRADKKLVDQRSIPKIED